MKPQVLSERLYSCRILAGILRQEGSLASLAQTADRDSLNLALVQELCYGVCRWYHRLDYCARRLLAKPLRSKDSDLHCLILLGLYQLYFMRIPPHAAVNETVAVVDALGKPWARGLINALLREAQRREEELAGAAAADYAAWYSHPQWLLDRLKQDWPAVYREILDANNSRAPMTLRVNAQKLGRPDYLALLQEAGLPATAGQLTTTALLLETPCDVHRLPGFADGLVSVQDEASQLAAHLLPLAPGLRVLDACAAPGGKTCALLEREPTLRVLALDQDAKRLLRVHENLDRLGLQADVRCSELSQDQTLAPASFDRILLDVPCSATGVIRRHPDIKLLRSAAEVATLVERQAALLAHAWTLLAPGGYLLYSTCSVLKAENSDQISAFLDHHPEAQLQPLAIPGAQVCAGGLQLLPGTAHADGFFYALLQK